MIVKAGDGKALQNWSEHCPRSFRVPSKKPSHRRWITRTQPLGTWWRRRSMQDFKHYRVTLAWRTQLDHTLSSHGKPHQQKHQLLQGRNINFTERRKPYRYRGDEQQREWRDTKLCDTREPNRRLVPTDLTIEDEPLHLELH
eukprot:1339667-Amphidinium_carterae.1